MSRLTRPGYVFWVALFAVLVAGWGSAVPAGDRISSRSRLRVR
jgi:hypothetical protein